MKYMKRILCVAVFFMSTSFPLYGQQREAEMIEDVEVSEACVAWKDPRIPVSFMYYTKQSLESIFSFLHESHVGMEGKMHNFYCGIFDEDDEITFYNHHCYPSYIAGTIMPLGDIHRSPGFYLTHPFSTHVDKKEDNGELDLGCGE